MEILCRSAPGAVASLRLGPCAKACSSLMDKAADPADTVRHAEARLRAFGGEILAETVRIDKGRLGIPVYMSIYGPRARNLLSCRKQMGKGASPEQAKASALMELVERYSFFSYWRRAQNGLKGLNWHEAEEAYGASLMPVEEISRSVADEMEAGGARELLNLLPWHFCPALNLKTDEMSWLPLDWFKAINEYNGASAGNTAEESILQGLCELVERHVSARLLGTELPTIDPASCQRPILRELLACFARTGVNLVLKDFSLGLPVPTVGALAWDPATFPHSSEIVFTAGTASSPEKAAIRAITEVAQLGGDFCTGSCYEASGLPKYHSLSETEWLLRGPDVSLQALPTLASDDIYDELRQTVHGLGTLPVYALDTTVPELGLPANYTVVPGLDFRERDRNQSLGLFTGRRIAEELPPDDAEKALDILAKHRPGAHYLPFYRGLLALRKKEYGLGKKYFMMAAPQQPDSDSSGLAFFYAAYADSLLENWRDALPNLQRALDQCPEMLDSHNLLGVSHYKLGHYAEAALCFEQALKLDRGSATDLANLGLCHQKLGAPNEAAACLEQALHMDPDLDYARAGLAELRGRKQF